MTVIEAISSVGGWSPIALWNILMLLHELAELEQSPSYSELEVSMRTLLKETKEGCMAYLTDFPMHPLNLDFDEGFCYSSHTELELALLNIARASEYLKEAKQRTTVDQGLLVAIEQVESWLSEASYKICQEHNANMEQLSRAIYMDRFIQLPKKAQLYIWEDIDESLQQYSTLMRSRSGAESFFTLGKESVAELWAYIEKKLKNLKDISLDNDSMLAYREREQECKELLLHFLRTGIEL